jgi:hypothetical protein
LQQNEPFDYHDFNLVEDYWVRYEGIYLFIKVILFKITNKDLENSSYQMMKFLKETFRKIVLMDKEHFTINLEKNNMEYGNKIF